MLVKNWMTTEVVCVEADTPLENAIDLLQEHGFAALPVLQNRQLAGMIFETDLLRHRERTAAQMDPLLPSAAIDARKLSECMQSPPTTVNGDHTVEEAMDRLLTNHVCSAPVLDRRQRLVGIIAMADLLRALVSVTGAARRGVHMAFEVEDRPGELKELTETISRYGGRMASLFMTSRGASRGRRRTYVRLFDIDRFRLLSLLEELRNTNRLIYSIDRKEVRLKK